MNAEANEAREMMVDRLMDQAEILRDLALLDPMSRATPPRLDIEGKGIGGSGPGCRFCLAPSVNGLAVTHRHGCVWQRAVEATR